jgi:hypothetical protein
MLLNSIREMNFYNKFAFSGSFGVYLYKVYLSQFYPEEIDLDTWKPKDIDIIVDNNVKDIMNRSNKK